MWVFDTETLRFLAVNDAAIRKYGWSREEFLAMTLRDIRPSEDVPLLMRDLAQDRGGLERIGIRRHLTRDGRRLWVEITVHKLQYVGRPAKLVLASDVTEQRLAEQRVRESEERLRALLQKVPTVAIQGYSSDGTVHYWNEASEQLYGFSRDEALGKNLFDLIIPPELAPQVRHTITDVIHRGVMIPNGERELIRKNATPIHVYSSHAVLHRSGEEPELFCFDIDLTERRRHEIALAASNRALKLINRCGEALIRCTTEEELLTEICRLAVEGGEYRMAWVGFVRDDSRHSIDCVASHHSQSHYPNPSELCALEAQLDGRGPAGRAIRLGLVQVCHDIEQDAHFAGWRAILCQHGLRGVICLPLRDDQRIFGVLVLYHSEPIFPGPVELEMLQNLADNLAFGIENLRSQRERQRIMEAVQKVAASVSASSGKEFFESLAYNMVEALGADAGFISQLLPGNPAAARSIGAVRDGHIIPNQSFLLDGSPCANLIFQDEFIVHADLTTLYPHSPCIQGFHYQVYVGRRLADASGRMVGMIFVLFKDRVRVNEFILSTLKIFATRVAAELDRLHADSLVREQASLLDKAQDAIIVRDLNHHIRYWNKSAERMYGWSTEEILHHPIPESLYQDPDAFHLAVSATMTRGEWMGEMVQRTKSGETKIVEGRWSLVRDDQHQPKSILVINTDITERKKLEQQFLRAQRIESIGTLAGGIAHDLNNVLTPILMSIELLRQHVKDPKGQKILDMVGKSARRGAEMVRQVLSFARGAEGKPVEVQMAHLVRDLTRIIEETFPKSVRVSISLPPEGAWLVMADPTQLHQVLINLCVNARDAMPLGGHISLSVENLWLDENAAAANLDAKPGPYLKIEVLDTGHGIPDSIIDKIFDPFFTTKEVGKGTGLGLSTSLAIIRSHGGFIRVQSEPGAGASFRCYLPAIPDVGQSNRSELTQPIRHGAGETILVVDDEPAIREVACRTLSAHGYQVLLAADGSEAVSLFVKHRDAVSLVLTDLLMPVMDGPATIEVIRLLKPSIKIIASGGIPQTDHESLAADAYLQKPYASRALLETVSGQLHPSSEVT